MLETVRSYIWGNGLLVLLLGTGLLCSLRTGFFQIFGIRQICKHTLCRLLPSQHPSAEQGQWKTCSSALAAAMGTGNIIGVSVALAAGGAGAIFWMWISAVFGMMLTYAENILSARFRKVNADGAVIGGAMAYLHYGLHCPPLAVIYAIFCVLASFGMGNMTQSSAAAAALERSCGIPPVVTGVIVFGLLAVTVQGGAKKIGAVTQIGMPILTVFYILASAAVLFLHRDKIPSIFQRIFIEAWQPVAAGGGTLGAVISVGLRHGVFSNEAGLGSSGVIHSESRDFVPGQQAMWSMVEVAVDTLLCCTLTALVVLSAGTEAIGGIGGVTAAFSCIFGTFAEPLLSWVVAMFAVATLLGWCCCGEQAVRYLLGEKGVWWYHWAYSLAGGVGAVVTLTAAWELSDIANGLMAIPNLLGILLLLRYVQKPGKIGNPNGDFSKRK